MKTFGRFVSVIEQKSGSLLMRVGSESTSMSTAWFLEKELDELQKEIMHAKAYIYQRRKELAHGAEEQRQQPASDQAKSE